MITVWLDEITPCLKDSVTGDIVETEVVQIQRTSFLKKFNKDTYWYVNWASLAKDCEIYALVIAGTVDIQGLVAIQPKKEYGAVYVSWMVTAPHNNKNVVKQQKYYGVGGHLFAIAIQKSVEYGFSGVITGFAASEELLEHYVKWFDAEALGTLLHPYQFVIEGMAARKVVADYVYRWTDDKL
jgi:hypothetical protein